MERSDSRILKTLDKDELMHIILFKSINIAKKREMHDVVKRMGACNIVFGYDRVIQNYFKTLTRDNLINILQDNDEMVNMINNIDIIFKRVAKTNGINTWIPDTLDSI